jgi:hypothetical protein
VILEEFTGINCAYCPTGHKKANELVDLYPGRLIPINIHAGPFAEPNFLSEPDFRTTHGTGVRNMVGVGTFPSAIVNRGMYVGIGSSGDPTIMTVSNWQYAINSQLDDTSYVNIASKASINVNTRKLDVETKLYFTSNGPNQVKFHIALLQNHVEGPQLNGYALNPDQILFNGNYDHGHMFRTYLTGQWGEIIDSTQEGSLITKQHSIIIPESYFDIDCELENIELVVFVSEGQKRIVTGVKSEIEYEGLKSNDATCLDTKKPDSYCGHEIDNIEVHFKNIGSEKIDSVRFEYQVIGKPLHSVNWYGDLDFNEKGVLYVNSVDVSNLVNSNIEFHIKEVNGVIDSNLTNNSINVSINRTNHQVSGTEFNFVIYPDQFGPEVTWEIIDNTTGGIINYGGPYAIIPNSAPLDTHVINISLDNPGCHTINVYDSGHNGMNSFWKPGGYHLEDMDGNVLLSSDGVFRDKQTKYFYIEYPPVSTEELVKPSINLYPNPVSDVLYMQAGGLINTDIAIYNSMGKLVYSESNMDLNHEQKLDISHLNSGIYFVNIHSDSFVSTKKIIVNN